MFLRKGVKFIVRVPRALGRRLYRCIAKAFFIYFYPLPFFRPRVALLMAQRGLSVPDYNPLPLARTVELIPGLSSGNERALQESRKLTEKFFQQKITTLADSISILGTPASTYSGKNVMLLATSDPEGRVEDYVRFHAESMQRAGWHVILVTDKPPQSLYPSCFDFAVVRNCPGYDFTSWRAAFEVCPGLFEASQVLLTNDSIFAPVGDIVAVHERMRSVECDFWGLAESHAVQPHLQSYYLVFRAPALKAESFRMFWTFVPASASRVQAIGCELTLALWLVQNGLKAGAYLPADVLLNPKLNPSHACWELCLDVWGMCFFKRDLLMRNVRGYQIKGWAEKVAAHGYPIDVIQTYLDRMRALNR